MAYSEDFRKRVVEYLDEGHIWEETKITFKISLTAISSWRKKYKETGEIKDKPLRQRAYKKLDPEKLKLYVQEHPDAYLKEIGEAFGCSGTAVSKAFSRLKITQKKRRRGIGNRSLSK
jgi:transposase